MVLRAVWSRFFHHTSSCISADSAEDGSKYSTSLEVQCNGFLQAMKKHCSQQVTDWQEWMNSVLLSNHHKEARRERKWQQWPNITVEGEKDLTHNKHSPHWVKLRDRGTEVFPLFGKVTCFHLRRGLEKGYLQETSTHWQYAGLDRPEWQSKGKEENKECVCIYIFILVKWYKGVLVLRYHNAVVFTTAFTWSPIIYSVPQ